MIRAAFANIPDGGIDAISLVHSIYPRSCIEHVVEGFESSCLITSSVVGDTTVLTLNVRPECRAQAREIAWSFLTELVRDASAFHLQV